MTAGGALEAAEAAENAARHAYGRLLAYITLRTRNIASAEDALGEAFASALRVWPKTGVPRSPEAWLLTAARRVVGHGERHLKVLDGARSTLELLHEEASLRTADIFPDERLKLLFACAHPAIDPAVRTPLMLQTVLGLDAARIAAAFVVKPAAMGQRLARAKTKIRDAGIPFEIPEAKDLPPRLADVLSAIYAAFGAGWDLIGEADMEAGELALEALYLGRLMVELMPDEPEPKGLLALMLYCEARRAARRDATGAYVPLSEQDRSLWSADRITLAERLLTEAAEARRFGRFQAEAAIQSVHVQAPRGGKPNGAALVALYDLLAVYHPTIGVLVSRATAHGAHLGPARGLALLAEIPAEAAECYQPYWAAKLHLHRERGDTVEAEAAKRKAIALAGDAAVISHLEGL